jgi:two-component system catabolic regulation response regulator CreB/two-component system response regulator ChvI
LILSEQNKLKVLVVDDEYDINLTLKILLNMNGFEVDNYSDPVEALQNFKPNVYSLLILDLKMPKMGGFQLYEEIRRSDSKVKVCFLTAGEIYSDIFKQKDFNPTCFIRKPIENDELIKRLNHIIESS